MNNNLPSFSIAIVHYKTLELTQVCLELLKKHLDNGDLDANKVDVWVVDNGSKDASTDYLRSLDWIHLIEREPVENEEGFAAHGAGLNLIFSQIKTDFIFLMHTDTFIYNPQVFDFMLQKCSANVTVVGCLEQLNRGYLRTAWRLSSRFCKHYVRRTKLAMGLNSKEPKPYRETHIKSFFALWNAKLMREKGYTFMMAHRIPGYELQDLFLANGYKITTISAMKLFTFLDHVEAGTVGLKKGYTDLNRRVKHKMQVLKKVEQNKIAKEQEHRKT
jgi:glycosyltransferase involved in cell wall biosynthesis